jgi:hypothetical protein
MPIAAVAPVDPSVLALIVKVLALIVKVLALIVKVLAWSSRSWLGRQGLGLVVIRVVIGITIFPDRVVGSKLFACVGSFPPIPFRASAGRRRSHPLWRKQATLSRLSGR